MASKKAGPKAAKKVARKVANKKPVLEYVEEFVIIKKMDPCGIDNVSISSRINLLIKNQQRLISLIDGILSSMDDGLENIGAPLATVTIDPPAEAKEKEGDKDVS